MIPLVYVTTKLLSSQSTFSWEYSPVFDARKLLFKQTVSFIDESKM